MIWDLGCCFLFLLVSGIECFSAVPSYFRCFLLVMTLCVCARVLFCNPFLLYSGLIAIPLGDKVKYYTFVNSCGRFFYYSYRVHAIEFHYLFCPPRLQ